MRKSLITETLDNLSYIHGSFIRNAEYCAENDKDDGESWNRKQAATIKRVASIVKQLAQQVILEDDEPDNDDAFTL